MCSQSLRRALAHRWIPHSSRRDGIAGAITSPHELKLAVLVVTPPSSVSLFQQTLDASDEFRIKMTEQLLEKLFAMGVINTKKSLAKTETVSVSAFCR